MTETVSLTLGSAIIYVTGTVNAAPVAWTAAEGNRWCAVVERAESGVYAIEISAYDAAGNRSDYAVVLEYGLHFKLNWTARDYLNAEDLIRLERNVIALVDLINLHGGNVSVESKTDWVATDLPRQGDIDRIRRNIDALQAGFAALPDWKEILYNNTLNAEQLNAWEWDMASLARWIERMVASFVYCGEFYAGEGFS